jgi:hypothetical protein
VADESGRALRLEFSGELWHWTGPAPWHFVTVPEPESAEIEAVAAFTTYGWGMVPVVAVVGGTQWRTSLYPQDGGYVVPVKAAVRRAEGIDVGDVVTVVLTVGDA